MELFRKRVRIIAGAEQGHGRIHGWTGAVMEVNGELLEVALDEGGTALVFVEEVEKMPSWADLRVKLAADSREE